MLAVGGTSKGVVAKAQEGRLVVIGDEPDVAALAAIAAVGTPLRHVRFSSKAHAAGPAVTALGVQLGGIDEGRHVYILRPGLKWPRS